MLKTADQAKDDPETCWPICVKRLSTTSIEHRRYRKHLSEQAPGDDDLAALIDEAEAIVVDLLAGDDA